MGKAVKFAISLSEDEFRELEALRKDVGLGRSAFVSRILRNWRQARERERMIAQYEEGYRRLPESPTELEAWEKASASAFSEGPW